MSDLQTLYYIITPSLPPSLSLPPSPLPPSPPQLPYVEMRLKVLVIGISYAVSVLNALIALRIILTSGVGKNGSTVAVSCTLKAVFTSVDYNFSEGI